MKETFYNVLQKHITVYPKQYSVQNFTDKFKDLSCTVVFKLLFTDLRDKGELHSFNIFCKTIFVTH